MYSKYIMSCFYLKESLIFVVNIQKAFRESTKFVEKILLGLSDIFYVVCVSILFLCFVIYNVY